MAEEEQDWYTTTFSIPKWLGEKLKEKAREKELSGMNMIVVAACTNYLLGEDRRKNHNERLQILYDSETINEEDYKALWLE